MDQDVKLFNSFSVQRDKGKLRINIELIFYGLDKFGYYSLYIIPLALSFYLPINLTVIGAVIIKTIIMIFLVIITRLILARLFSSPVLIINKAENKMESKLDLDTILLSEIKDMAIMEYHPEGSNVTMYKIKFILQDGEKTLPFSLTKYRIAEDMLHVIKAEVSEEQKT